MDSLIALILIALIGLFAQAADDGSRAYDRGHAS